MSIISHNNNQGRYTLITQLSELQLEQLHRLYQHEWWSTNRTLDETKKIVVNSSMIFGMVNQQNDLVVFCRVLTDSCFFAYLYDVIVKSDHRKQGLSNMLLKAVIAHPELSKLDSIELVCRGDDGILSTAWILIRLWEINSNALEIRYHLFLMLGE